MQYGDVFSIKFICSHFSLFVFYMFYGFNVLCKYSVCCLRGVINDNNNNNNNKNRKSHSTKVKLNANVLSLPLLKHYKYMPTCIHLVHQALSRHVPSYLADDCCLVTDARPRRLRSAETRTLLVSRTQTNFCDKAFSAAGPRVWNYLLTDLRQEDLS